MNHTDWIRAEMRTLGAALGFRYTPETELQQRVGRIKSAMRRTDVDALLVVQKMDCFYFSGTTQDAVLFIPIDGEPLLMVKREVERARAESAWPEVIPMRSSRELPALIKDHRSRLPGVMGLELDVVPVNEYLGYGELFRGTRIVDSSELIRDTRAIKSSFEIELMRRAGEIGRQVYIEGAHLLREGMTEIEFGGLLEAVAKQLGHEGLLRVRSMNYEAYPWHVLSGPNGGIVSQSDSPMGGLGMSPAFPVGASRRQMKGSEPILVDFGICYHGYLADETRMFCIGAMQKKFVDAYEACRRIQDAVLDAARPGADCQELFTLSVRLAESLGYRDSYLGPPGLQTRFVGHGIGLELAEPPFLARNHTYPLQEGMTFALEPKMVFPGEGAVGIENTVVVTGQGVEMLTPLDQAIIYV
jgi:Xaa-Pro aminopeptidase